MPDQIVVVEDTVTTVAVTATPTPTVVVAATGLQGAPGGDVLANYTQLGPLTPVTGTIRFPVDGNYRLRGCYVMVSTAPTGQPIIVDVLKNGSTVYTTTANRPTIPVGGFASTSTFATPDVTDLHLGDYLTCSILQVGAPVAGADLSLIVIADRIP